MKLKKPQLTLPKLPKVSKKVVLISAGAAVLLAVFLVAMVAQVRQYRADQAAAHAREARFTSLQAQVKTLQTKLDVSQSEVQHQAGVNASVCDWVRTTQTARRQAVPPLCIKH